MPRRGRPVTLSIRRRGSCSCKRPGASHHRPQPQGTEQRCRSERSIPLTPAGSREPDVRLVSARPTLPRWAGVFSTAFGLSVMQRKNVVQLGSQEHEILRAIARSPSFPLSSMQRLRFEMLGLIEDRAKGIRLTERGRKLASEPIPAPPPTQAARDRSGPRDKRGRRLGHQRHTPF